MPGFLDQLKALFAGAQEQAPPPEPEGAPWEQPVFGDPSPVPSPVPSPTPSPIPVQPVDEAMQKALELQRQKELVKRLVPERAYNR